MLQVDLSLELYDLAGKPVEAMPNAGRVIAHILTSPSGRVNFSPVKCLELARAAYAGKIEISNADMQELINALEACKDLSPILTAPTLELLYDAKAKKSK